LVVSEYLLLCLIIIYVHSLLPSNAPLAIRFISFPHLAMLSSCPDGFPRSGFIARLLVLMPCMREALLSGQRFTRHCRPAVASVLSRVSVCKISLRHFTCASLPTRPQETQQSPAPGRRSMFGRSDLAKVMHPVRSTRLSLADHTLQIFKIYWFCDRYFGSIFFAAVGYMFGKRPLHA